MKNGLRQLLSLSPGIFTLGVGSGGGGFKTLAGRYPSVWGGEVSTGSSCPAPEHGETDVTTPGCPSRV